MAGRCGSCAHAQSCSRALTEITAASGLPQPLQFPLLMCVLEPVGHLQLFVCKRPPAPSRDWARLHKPAMHWEPSPGDAPCILCYQSNAEGSHTIHHEFAIKRKSASMQLAQATNQERFPCCGIGVLELFHAFQHRLSLVL